jgi:hypothetical protein
MENKSVIVLRRADEDEAEINFAHEIIPQTAEGQRVLVKLEQGLPVEMCRRFADDTARYFGAALDDQTASHDQSFEGWLKQTLKDIKMKDRENA